MGSMASESQIPRRRSKKKKIERIIDGGKKRFFGLALTQSTVDQLITGIDNDNSVKAQGAYTDSLKTYAGFHNWGKQSDLSRFNMWDPSAPYAHGKRMVASANKDSKVDEVAFGVDFDGGGDPDAWLQTEAFRGAFGGVSFNREMKEFGGAKRKFSNAPVDKAVLDEVIYGIDIDGSSQGAKQAWLESLADRAGYSSYATSNQATRFEGISAAGDPENRLGKKLWLGNPNRLANVDHIVFNNDIDGGGDLWDEYKEHMESLGLAGRPCWEMNNQHNVKNRYWPKEDDEPHNLGRRRYANAPNGRKLEEGARWSQVAYGCAGKPGGGCANIQDPKATESLRYHKGKIPKGRRRFEDHPSKNALQETMEDLSFDCDSQESSVHAGMMVHPIRGLDVPENTTSQSRAVFQPPSRKALDEAARRGEKNKQNRRAHENTGVAQALGGRSSAASSSQPRQRKERPKSSPGVGPKGPSMYGRDFRPMSTSDLAAAAAASGAMPTPLGERSSAEGECKGAGNLLGVPRHRRMPHQAKPRQSSEVRHTPRGTLRGSPQGTPQPSGRGTPGRRV